MAGKVVYDEQKGEISFSGVMEEAEKFALQSSLPRRKGKPALDGYTGKPMDYRQNKPKSPADGGETFSIPLLSIKQGNLFEAF